MCEIPSAGDKFRGEDGTVSTILPSNYGQDGEASEGELEEYAEYIGIDVAKEPQLMYIAKEGLQAPLPESWRACQTDDNEVYYFNFETGESLWDHPMDAHYKACVIAAREKGETRANVGPGPSAGQDAKSTATKAIADSFFLNSTAASVNRSAAPLGSIAGSSLKSVTPVMGRVPGVLGDDGVSATRAPPDASDILALSSQAAFPSGIGASRSAPVTGPFRIKEAEAALRKRLEEVNESQLRLLRIELGKKMDAHRQQLAETKRKVQTELESAWERDNSTGDADASVSAMAASQRRLRLARDVKQIEESWQTRLQEVTTRVCELTQQVESKEQSLRVTSQQPPEELKKALEAQNAAALTQVRDEKKKEQEASLAQVKREQAASLAEVRQQSSDTVAAAQKAGEAEHARKMQERRTQNESMLAALRAAVASKKAALKAEEAKRTRSVPAMAGASPLTDTATRTDGETAALVAAQTAADLEVAKAKEASAAATTRLRETYAARVSEKQAAVRAAKQAVSPSGASSHHSSPTPSGSLQGGGAGVSGISAEDQAKLDEEDKKLSDELRRAARIFEEETRLMVANVAAGRAATAAPTSEVAATVSAEAVTALSRAATQEQRARDAENMRHTISMKQLEAKHEQATRAIRAQLDKTIAASKTNGFHPRRHASFAPQFTARKRAWLRDHPAPPLDLPSLPPIPSLPTTTLQSQMEVVPQPDEEEQAALIKAHLVRVREAVQQQNEQELQELQRDRKKDIEKWKEQYRSKRVAEVQATLTTLRNAMLAERENAAAQQAAQAAAAAREAEAEKVAKDRLKQLHNDLEALESKMTATEESHKRQTRSLEENIAELEATLLTLRQEESEAEEAKNKLLRQQQEQERGQAQLEATAAIGGEGTTQPSPITVGSSASLTDTSDALYVGDAEAAAEEAALRTRWVALLKVLRTAVHSEMSLYERALEDSYAQCSTLANSGFGALDGKALPQGGGGGTGSGEAPNTITTPRDRLIAANASASLPPPAPSVTAPASTSMGASSFLSAPQLPPVTSSMPASCGAPAISSAGYSTPLLRPSRASDDGDVRTGIGRGGVANVVVRGRGMQEMHAVPSPQLRLTSQQWDGAVHGQHPLMASTFLNQSPALHRPLCWDTSALSSTEPLPASGSQCLSVDPNASRFTGASSAASPYGNPPSVSGPSLPQSTATGYGATAATAAEDHHRFTSPYSELSKTMVSAVDRPDFHGRFENGGGPGAEMIGCGYNIDDGDNVEDLARQYRARLAYLQQAIRTQRKDLQDQRNEMEQWRAEWRVDMQACKRRGDRALMRHLRGVKAELEGRARELNMLVLQLRELQENAHREVRQFRRWMAAQDEAWPEGLPIGRSGVAAATKPPRGEFDSSLRTEADADVSPAPPDAG